MILKISMFLAVLILFVLLLKINLFFSYKNNVFNATVKVLFFQKVLYPQKGKKRKKEEKKEEQEVEKNLADLLKWIEISLEPVKKAFGVFKRKCVFENFRLEIVYSTGDAAKTAISYGVLCAVVYNFLLCLEMNFDFRKKEINIRPAYTDPLFEGNVELELYMRIWHIFILILKLIKIPILFYKNKNKKKIKAV